MFRRVPLRYKIAFSVGAVTLLTVFTLGRLIFGPLADMSLDELGLRVQAAAVAAASYVDPQWVAAVDPAQAADSQVYHNLDGKLQELKQMARIHGFHLFRFRSGREAEAIYNSYPPDSPHYKRPGTVENIVDSPVLFAREPEYAGITLEQPGDYVGAWVPILAGDGSQLGNMVAVVEFTALNKKYGDALNFIGLMALAFSAMGGYAGYRVGATFEQTAVTDGLMGIFNHRHFKQRLETEVARSSRYGLPLSLVMIDIDHFKRVNDTYGHAVGDLVLKHLARWVVESSRRTDLVARYGGEEIAVILPHTGLAGAQEFAERLRLKVANAWVRDADEEVTLRVTISIGVAQHERRLSMIDFIKRADAALYQSKHNGRNRVTIWTDDLVPSDPEPDAPRPAGPLEQQV